MAAYTQLVLPVMPTNPDAAATANWLGQAAANLVNGGNSFLQSLSDLKDTNFASIGDLPEFTSAVWAGDTNGIYQRPSPPNVGIITTIPLLLDQLRTLIPPSPTGNESFSYTEPGYSSALRQPMIEKLLTDLVSGGYGIDTTDEVALFNRARDREAMLAQASVDEVTRQSAAAGFPLPQGALFAQLNKVRQDQSGKLSTVNRDIALRRSELYVENRRKVIDQVLASETQSLALYDAIQGRTIQTGQIKAQLAIALLQAGIQLFESRVRVLTSQVDATVATTTALTNIYNADVQAYAAYVNAVVAGAQIDVANSRNQLARDVASHQSRVDIVRFKLQQLGLTVENSKGINQYGTEFFRTALGSAMSGITGLMVNTKEL